MSDIHRSRSGVMWNGNELPPLPLKREELKADAKGKVPKLEVKAGEVFISLHRLLKDCPSETKFHVLWMRVLQWSHGFDPEHRDLVDEVQASFLADYDAALRLGGDAMKVAREMLKYQCPITEVGSDLIKRDEILARLCKDFVYKKKTGGKSGKRAGGKAQAAAAAVDKKEQKRA
jgi:hypothetical protein